MADTFKGIITADGKKRQLPYGSVLDKPVSDETLSIQGGFADSKVVGNNFKKAKAETDSLKEDLSDITSDIYTYEELKININSDILTQKKAIMLARMVGYKMIHTNHFILLPILNLIAI